MYSSQQRKNNYLTDIIAEGGSRRRAIISYKKICNFEPILRSTVMLVKSLTFNNEFVIATSTIVFDIKSNKFDLDICILVTYYPRTAKILYSTDGESNVSRVEMKRLFT